jgi:hypothetical protein
MRPSVQPGCGNDEADIPSSRAGELRSASSRPWDSHSSDSRQRDARSSSTLHSAGSNGRAIRGQLRQSATNDACRSSSLRRSTPTRPRGSSGRHSHDGTEAPDARATGRPSGLCLESTDQASPDAGAETDLLRSDYCTTPSSLRHYCSSSKPLIASRLYYSAALAISPCALNR